MVRAIFEGLLDFLYPKGLPVLELESMSAGDLLSSFPAAEDLGPGTLAIFSYADPRVRDLVWELKYRKNTKLAGSLAAIVFDVLRQELADRALFENFVSPLLIPMPMSEKRRLDRGWNQTEVLCEAVKELDSENIFEYRKDFLSKTVHTESQTLIENKKQRLRNVENSMQSKNVTGRCVVLIDDVTTTGASFKEASRALRSAGARRILCLALAH